MKRHVLILLLTLTAVFSAPLAALAALDQYVGDSAIYSGSTEYLRPNVLFVVDNSAAMEQAGSREPYDPAETYTGSYVTNKVYERKTATGGVINYVQYIADVASVTCATASSALTTTGYYAGELKKDGTCNAPKSGNYFLGNILNYIESSTDPSAWEAETAYATGHFIRRLIGGDNYIYEATAGGTSGSSEPDWPTGAGETVTDDGVTWQVSDSVWAASTSYAVGDIVRQDVGGIDYIYQATTAGSSGTTAPTWPTAPGATVVDNEVTWALPGDIIDMVQDTLKQVVAGARESVNFGVMTFGDNNAGGKVVRPVMKLHPNDPDDTGTAAVDDGPTNYTALRTSIDGITLLTANAQPVNETLHDASYYFRGLNSSASKIASDNEPYPTPIEYVCQKNFVIVLTTGATDTDNPKTRAIGDLNGDGYEGYIDDLAKDNYETDLVLSTTEDERIQTHIIQLLTPEVQRLKDATNASHGRGDYFKVNNSHELTQALLDAMANIVNESDTSFVAPVVPTSPENRTYSGQRVYLGFFKPISQRPWHGNLKKYGIDHQNRIIDKNDNVATLDDGSFSASAHSFWSASADAGAVEEGGAGEVLLNRNLSANPRKIYINRGGNNESLLLSANAFISSNVSAADLGVADDDARDTLIDFINGYDAYDDDGDGTYGNPGNGEKRDWILGDILHSKPQIINYNTYDFTATNEASCTTNKTMIYVGTNDGMLHAFRDCDGEEVWAFIPDNLLPNLKELAERPAKHTYFVDSSPISYIYDHDDDGNIGPGPETGDADPSGADSGTSDKVLLLFGQRRGGDAYYALDVTDPLVPKFLWKIDSGTTGFGELGQTWSEPQLGTVKYLDGGTTKKKIVAFVGAGYDNDNEDGRFGNTQGFTNADVVTPTDDDGNVTSTATVTPDRDGSPYGVTNAPKGRGIYAFEVATLDADLATVHASDGVPAVPTSPVKVWDFTYGTSGTNAYNRSRLMYSIPSDLTVVDTDYDGYTDRLYVGDTGGQLWRICAYYPGNYSDVAKRYLPYARALINTTNDPWFGKRLFEANTSATNSSEKGRKFFYRPSIAFETGGIFALYLGSGDRAHPLNTAVTDRLYAIYDRGQKTSELKDEDDLVDVTANILQEESTAASDVTDKLAALSSATNYGWYIGLERLNDASAHAGEKVLASALAFNKVAYYTTFTPNTSTSTDPCSPGNLGVSRLYAVDYKTGEAVLNFYGGNDTEATTDNARARSDDGKVLRDDDRTVELGVGIPSGLVVIMPPSGDAELLIGCGGGLCREDPVAGGTIIPIYWMSW